jgi:formate dehydrogenase iron-sulfur subunit
MAKGFFTDSTLCIGCKACEVACKQWNGLDADGYELTGDSYDNTGWLSGTTWRHVQFIEQFDGGKARWLMNSDVCKHCVQAACLEVCPTGAIIRTEFDTVYIQRDVCNGCRDCIAACPFGVIETTPDGVAQKCTLCYDRLQNGLEPACAKACPTESIQFGEVDELLPRARARVATLQTAGQRDAYLYGAPGDGYTEEIGGLNAFHLLLDKPGVYGLPERPKLGSRATVPSQLGGVVTGAILALGAAISFRTRGRRHAEAAATTTTAAAPPATTRRTTITSSDTADRPGEGRDRDGGVR